MVHPPGIEPGSFAITKRNVVGYWLGTRDTNRYTKDAQYS